MVDSKVDDTKKASAIGFERRVRKEFEALGYTIIETDGTSGSGYDFVAESYPPLRYRSAVEVKYYEKDPVSSANVLIIKRLLNQGFDGVAIVTTLGFTAEAQKIASESRGIILLTEADLVGKMSGRNRATYETELRNERYYLNFFEQFSAKRPAELLLKNVPKGELVSLLLEFLSSGELIHILEERVKPDELMRRLAQWVAPDEVLAVLTRERREPSPARRLKKRGIEEKYRRALSETDPNKKGKHFEDVVKELVALVEGLEVVGSNVNNGIQEIDIQVRNRNQENVWEAVFDPMVFIECKNWSEPVKSKEVRDFEGKLIHSNLKAGILISVNGLSGDGMQGGWGAVKEAHQNGRSIIVLDGGDLNEIFACKDVSEKVDERYVGLYQIGSSTQDK